MLRGLTGRVLSLACRPDGEPRFATLFAVLAALICPFLILTVPPSQVADEPAHLLRADSVGRGEWVGSRQLLPAENGRLRPVAGVVADPALFEIGRGMVNGARYDAARIARVNGLPWAGTPAFYGIFTIATYAPLLYGPAALTLHAGEAAGLKPYPTILAARCVNALVFVALGCSALAMARRGRAILFCVLAVPMTLSLASSLNQDGLLIACAVLAAAAITRRDEVGDRLSGWDAAAAALLAVVALAKPPYLPLLMGLVVPWSGRIAPGLLARRFALVALAALPAVSWAAYTTAAVATPVLREAYEAGPLWTGPRPAPFFATDPAAQLAVLKAQPSLLWRLPLNLRHDAPLIVSGAIGLLSWATLAFPTPFYLMWLVATAAALVHARWGWTGSGAARPRVLAVLMLGFAAGFTLWGVAMSQYLSWTSVGYPHIDGPQGRYLLPVLPLLAVAARPSASEARPAWRRWAAWLPVAAAAVNLVAVPALILRTYTEGGVA